MDGFNKYPVDILLITVNDIETREMFNVFRPQRGKQDIQHQSSNVSYTFLRTIAGANIWHIQSGMGSTGPRGSQLTLYEAIHAVKPKAVFMVGVACGLKKNGGQKIGDVLISAEIIPMGPNRIGWSKKGRRTAIVSREQRAGAATRLLDRFITARRRWNGARIEEPGLILSDDYLLDNPIVRDKLKKKYPEARGYEMEGTGLYAAAAAGNVRWILVKGICDWGDGYKGHLKAARQKLAAANAAKFVLRTLRAGGIIDPIDEKSTPKRKSVSKPKLPSTTPDLTDIQTSQRKFVGRRTQINQILTILRSKTSRPIIAIVGLGGIGKTALAVEIIERTKKEGLFDSIVMVSTQTERFIGAGVEHTGIARYTFGDLLSDIGSQCGKPEIAQAPIVGRIEAVRQLLRERRALIVLDNLETVRRGNKKQQDKLLMNANNILGNGKILATSRDRFEYEPVYSVSLAGLPLEEGIAFLQLEIQNRNIQPLNRLSSLNLSQIHSVTGGAPLAMRLVLGQMIARPPETVLQDLRDAHFNGQDYPFYRFIFRNSWKSLSTESKHVLVTMRLFRRGGLPDIVFRNSELETKAKFWTAIEQLVQKSLLDVEIRDDKYIYSVHPLTRYFITSDLRRQLK